MLGQHSRPNRAACLEQEDPHRGRRYAQSFGYLRGRVASHVDQLEYLTLPPRKLDAIRPHQTRDTSGAVIRADVFNHGASFNPRPAPSEQRRPTSLRPQAIEREIPRYLVQPAGEPAPSVELTGARVKSDQHELRDVVGLVVVSGQSPRPTTHAHAHASGELLEGGVAAATRPAGKNREFRFLMPAVDHKLPYVHDAETMRVVAAFTRARILAVPLLEI